MVSLFKIFSFFDFATPHRFVQTPPAEAFTFLAPENSSEDVVASSATRKTPVFLDDVMDIIGVSRENMGKS